MLGAHHVEVTRERHARNTLGSFGSDHEAVPVARDVSASEERDEVVLDEVAERPLFAGRRGDRAEREQRGLEVVVDHTDTACSRSARSSEVLRSVLSLR